MLNLTRKVDQSVYIDTPLGRITIMVCGVDRSSGQVVLGMVVPAAFNIARAELVDDERRRV